MQECSFSSNHINNTIVFLNCDLRTDYQKLDNDWVHMVIYFET